jgi:hypothetical protein
MKKLLFAVALLMPMVALAQDDYIDGTYWTVTGVDTNPGHFEDYMGDLNNNWRKSIEMLIKDGKVLSYRMFSNVNARVDEPNLWLLVEWKSGAAWLDTPRSYYDAQTAKLFGSVKKSDQANVKRGDLRTIMSDVLMREMAFK